MAKKCVLFFSRDYQAELFPRLQINSYESYHVTLSKAEKETIEKLGGKVVGCLEEEYHLLPEAALTFPYLKHAWGNDRFLKNYTYSQRLTIQKKVAGFWRAILEKYRPAGVVNEPVAIELAEIMYIECERLGIPYLALSSYMMQDTIFFPYTPLNGSYERQLDNVIPSSADLDAADKLIENIRTGYFQPSYTKNLNSRLSVSKLFINLKFLVLSVFRRFKIRNKEIRDLCYGDYFSLYKLNISHYFNSLFHSGKYNSLSEIPPDAKQAFFPLHLEPEATILYCAYFFCEQDSLIRNILKCIPENYVLVVKEHPNQPGALLEKRYLSIRKDYPNLILLRSEIPSRQLITQSELILTLGSSAGFEALTIGKPVINFGKMYYDSFEGVVNISSFEQLYHFFRTDITGRFPKGDIVRFVAKIFAQMKKGNPFVHDSLYSDANLAAIASSIADELSAHANAGTLIDEDILNSNNEINR